MNTTRSSLLQIETPQGWQWVFCYVVNTGKVATCEDYRKALRDAGDNRAYIEGKTSANVRAITPQRFASEKPIYGTLYEGQGCLHLPDYKGETRRTLSGCFSVEQIKARAYGAPVFDISALSMAEILRISDLPMADRVQVFAGCCSFV